MLSSNIIYIRKSLLTVSSLIPIFDFLIKTEQVTVLIQEQLSILHTINLCSILLCSLCLERLNKSTLGTD